MADGGRLPPSGSDRGGGSGGNSGSTGGEVIDTSPRIAD